MQILASSKVGNDKYELESPTKNLADLDLKQVAQDSQTLFEVTQGYCLSGNEGSSAAQVGSLSVITDANSTTYKDGTTKAIQTLVANNNLMTVDPTSTANSLILVARKIGTQIAPNAVDYTRTAPLPFIWENGLSFTFRAIATNTTGMTAQIPALAGLSGSIDILDEQGIALPASSIVTNKFYTVTTATISSVKKLLLRQPSVASASETQQGVIEIATNAETIAGSDTSRTVVPSGLAAWAAANDYVSSAQTITASAQTVLAHGLGAQPKSVSLWLENVTASIGYTTGQQVLINPAMNDSSDTTRSRAFSIIADATNITVRTPTDTGIIIGNVSTGGFGALVAANWKFVIKAKK